MSEVINVNFVQGRDYLQDVKVYAARAANSAADSANSATQSQSSANQSAQHANRSAQYATQSANSATQSANSATQSAQYATQSANHAETSKQYANIAIGSAENAEQSAQDAANSAETASSQATQVATTVTQVENIAAGIMAQAPPAWDSSTVYSYPAVVAYTDGQTYRCIGTDVPAGTTPDTSLEWVRLSVLGGDDFFDVDMQGSLMPAVNPTFAYSWQLDEDGNIMPRAASDTLGTEINTYAETALKTAQETLTTANEALARANTIIYEGIPVELDSAGNVTTTEDSL